MKSFFKNYRFSLILIVSIILGGVIGSFLGAKAGVFKPFGDIFLNLMFMLVVPLVFFSLTSAIADTASTKRIGKVLGWMMVVFLFTGLLSSLFMTLGVKLFPPSEGVHVALTKPDAADKVSLGDQLVKTFTTDDFVGLFSRQNMLALIVFSVLLGFSASIVGEKAKPFVRFLQAGSEVMMKMVNIVMFYAPIGLGSYFAYLIGSLGPQLAGNYLKAVLLYYPGSLLYFILFFSLYAFLAGGKSGIQTFWKQALPSMTTSLATCSSAATIPTNLQTTKKMGVKEEITETTIPIGAIIHKDGSVMGGVLKISFLFGIFNMPFHGFVTITSVILVSLLVGTVMGAIPSGGMIAETLIISLYGFPPEALPIIAAISTIIDPPATMLNATGDTVAAMLVNRISEGKNWLKKEKKEVSDVKGSQIV